MIQDQKNYSRVGKAVIPYLVSKSQSNCIIDTIMCRYLYLCNVTGALQSVERDVFIPWNTTTQGITVSTDSEVGSGERVAVVLYDKDGNSVGGVGISFYTQILYSIGGCTYNRSFQDTLPSQTQKTWTITYSTVELRVVYNCNEVQVVNVLLSDSFCTDNDSDWREYWEKKTTQIQFTSHFDTASDRYCISSNTGK